MTATGQMLMPWGAPPEAPQGADVAAATDAVPKAAGHCGVPRAAEALRCSHSTVYNMIEEGTLLAHRVNASPDAPKRKRYRIVVRLERTYDPARRKFLTLEEAARVRSNING